jgi:hypothetical protein
MFTLVPHKDGYAILKDTKEIVETFYASEFKEALVVLEDLNKPKVFVVHFLQARGTWKTLRGIAMFVPVEEFWSNTYTCEHCHTEEQAIRRTRLIFGGNHVLRNLRIENPSPFIP